MRADVRMCFVFLHADRREFKLSSFLWCVRSFSSSFRASEAVIIRHEGRSLLCNASTLVGHDEISFLIRYKEESILVPAMDTRSLRFMWFILLIHYFSLFFAKTRVYNFCYKLGFIMSPKLDCIQFCIYLFSSLQLLWNIWHKLNNRDQEKARI